MLVMGVMVLFAFTPLIVASTTFEGAISTAIAADPVLNGVLTDQHILARITVELAPGCGGRQPIVLRTSSQDHRAGGDQHVAAWPADALNRLSRRGDGGDGERVVSFASVDHRERGKDKGAAVVPIAEPGPHGRRKHLVEHPPAGHDAWSARRAPRREAGDRGTGLSEDDRCAVEPDIEHVGLARRGRVDVLQAVHRHGGGRRCRRPQEPHCEEDHAQTSAHW